MAPVPLEDAPRATISPGVDSRASSWRTSVYVDVRCPLVATNQAYRRRGGPRMGMYLTPEGAAFKTQVSYAARRAMQGRPLLEGPVSVFVDFWFKTRANDVDGPLKLVLDSLQGHVYANDRQVVFVSAAKHLADDPKQVGLSLTVRAVGGEP